MSISGFDTFLKVNGYTIPNMGRHIKEKRKAYLKRRKERIREAKIAQEDNRTNQIHDDTSDTRSQTTNATKNSHPESHTLSSSTFSWPSSYPSQLSSTPKSRGQICVNIARSKCTSESSTYAAVMRHEIPRKVQNDVLWTKWEEYKLLNKQLTLIKRRLNVIEYGKRGELLNQMGVDMKR